MAKILQFIRKLRLPKCSICNQPVELETAKTDEDGNLVHEDCYVRRARLKEIIPPAQSFHNPTSRFVKVRVWLVYPKPFSWLGPTRIRNRVLNSSSECWDGWVPSQQPEFLI